MSVLEQLKEFLLSPNGPIAVACLVVALGLIVTVKYLLRTGGVVSKRLSGPQRAAAAAAPAPAAKSADGRKSAVAAGAAEDEDEDASEKLTRRSRRYA